MTAQWGAALVEPETELDEAEIDAYGANSIGDLVSLIAPLTGRANEYPIILIDSERADGATGINGFPPEALARDRRTAGRKRPNDMVIRRASAW